VTFKTVEGARRAMEDSNKTIEVSVICLLIRLHFQIPMLVVQVTVITIVF
jgi:hypothetical protein